LEFPAAAAVDGSRPALSSFGFARHSLVLAGTLSHCPLSRNSSHCNPLKMLIFAIILIKTIIFIDNPITFWLMLAATA
jgi:hypothetical protein